METKKLGRNLRKEKQALTDRKSENFRKGREKGIIAKRMRPRTAMSYLKEAVKNIDPEQMKEVFATAMKDAIGGDAKARDFLGRYLCGGGKFDLRELAEPSVLRNE